MHAPLGASMSSRDRAGHSGLRTVREGLPDQLLLIVLLVVFQTIALSVIALLLDRWTPGWSSWWIAVVGLLAAVMVAVVYVWRERGRRKGTFISVVVQADDRPWANRFEAGLRWAQDHRLLYTYPLAFGGKLASGDRTHPADWSRAVTSVQAMLQVVLEETSGAQVDRRRLVFAVNAPLPFAFQLGAGLHETGLGAADFEVLNIATPPAGSIASPHIVWRTATGSVTGPATAGDPVNEDLVVVCRVPALRMGPFEGRSFRQVGAETTLSTTTEWDLKPIVEELRGIAAATPKGEVVPLALAMPAAAAFVLGRELMAQRSKFRLVNLGSQGDAYYEIITNDQERST